MKKIMMVGKIGCGKTTLSQRLTGDEVHYKKTQSIEVIGGSIVDTPGEYLEQRSLSKALIVTSVQADLVLLLLDATDLQFSLSPGMAGMFPRPVYGVITKADLCPDEKRLNQAKQLLQLAGARRIFTVGFGTDKGVEELRDAIEGAPAT